MSKYSTFTWKLNKKLKCIFNSTLLTFLSVDFYVWTRKLKLKVPSIEQNKLRKKIPIRSKVIEFWPLSREIDHCATTGFLLLMDDLHEAYGPIELGFAAWRLTVEHWCSRSSVLRLGVGTVLAVVPQLSEYVLDGLVMFSSYSPWYVVRLVVKHRLIIYLALLLLL